nr:putative disease resistance protein rpp1 [Quercus suber]
MIEGSNDHFLQHFTALEVLSLYNYNGDEMELEWQGLRKLQRLRLYDHPKLASLPVGLQQATSLRNLHIWNCPSLTTLPEWICEIISLQSLYIFDCPNLTSLPALTSLKTLEIRHCPNLTSLPALTSLKTLEIRRCPILVESCKSQDWIARIENLNLEEDSEQTSSFTKIFGRCSGSTTLGDNEIIFVARSISGKSTAVLACTDCVGFRL